MLLDAATNKPVVFYFREVGKEEIKGNRYLSDYGWEFNWLHPISHGFRVFGLVTNKNPDFVEGLIALKENPDEDFLCVDVDIIESAPQNKKFIKGVLNKERSNINVGRILIAFACWYSIDKGYDGYVGLTSKSSKYPFYMSMGARQTFGQYIMFDDIAASRLVKQYFPGGVLWWQDSNSN
ncbi:MULTISPECIES: hypothetical protein [Bacillus]|uniref:hypothetical protein n=1 Tax=Bacillus TaxID=1386 RepID=UPI00101B87D2|nr:MULTISPECIES: hypothetical protein [Bacillus]MDT0160617.1 hypothetical protein [Bacillus sp. AG4(2022)]RYI26714.1 hypothetical protein EVU96_20345 [Bacillus infantis]